MTEEELQHLIALTLVPQIGDVHTRLLLQHFGAPSAVFRARRRELERIPGIGSTRAGAIRAFRNMARAERELRFIGKHGVTALAHGTPEYPRRLAHCYDAPVILYYRGNADLNAQRIISIVGTRAPTDYGREWTAALLQGLAPFAPVVVSGLAYGIDTVAHRNALRNGLQTVGVVAHGLDRIYPPANRDLAKEMLSAGGLLSDFLSGIPPDAQNFPRRNRIVAGMADAVVVVETGEKGGSIITADIANSYDRDVFALPGRATDPASKGCNRLIHDHRAQLVTTPAQIVALLNWDERPSLPAKAQASLFPELSPSERDLLGLIRDHPGRAVDELGAKARLKPSETAAALLNLEMLGLVTCLPGKRYRPA